MTRVGPQLPAKTHHSLFSLALLGAVLWAVGSLLAPTRAWSSMLIVVYMLVTVGLGAVVFIALEYLTGAGWSVAFRRVPEALASTLPFCGLAMLMVVMTGASRYAWQPAEGAEAGTFWFKELWLRPGFLTARAAAYLVLWSLLAWALIGVSRRQDQTGGLGPTRTNRRISALALLVFAPTFSLAACDWFMALQPMWFSTVWGAYHFAGLAMSTLAVTVLLSLYLRHLGPFRGIFRDEHLHDLGKLLLGFSCFWMYLWFSQYMLIWYSNIPEETAYFIPRARDAWGPLMIANIAINWFVPFLALLPRPNKRSSVVMARVAALVLIGRWLDLYLMVVPATTDATSSWGLPEAGSILLAFAVICLLFFRGLSRAAIVPLGDPFLSESLHRGSHSELDAATSAMSHESQRMQHRLQVP